MLKSVSKDHLKNNDTQSSDRNDSKLVMLKYLNNKLLASPKGDFKAAFIHVHFSY